MEKLMHKNWLKRNSKSKPSPQANESIIELRRVVKK